MKKLLLVCALVSVNSWAAKMPTGSPDELMAKMQKHVGTDKGELYGDGLVMSCAGYLMNSTVNQKLASVDSDWFKYADDVGMKYLVDAAYDRGYSNGEAAYVLGWVEAFNDFGSGSGDYGATVEVCSTFLEKRGFGDFVTSLYKQWQGSTM